MQSVVYRDDASIQLANRQDAIATRLHGPVTYAARERLAPIPRPWAALIGESVQQSWRHADDDRRKLPRGQH
uniref:Transposase n=1 Tax=Ascaris lumbricoides TaxID=6252 RepID=A0A0M3I1I4_ASCLU